MSKPTIKIENWRIIPFNPMKEGSVVLIGKIIEHPKYGTYIGRTGEIVIFNEDEMYAESINTRYILGEGEEDRLKKTIGEKKKDVDKIKDDVNELFEKEREKEDEKEKELVNDE